MPRQRSGDIYKYLSVLTALFIAYNTLIPFRPYLEPWKILRNIHRIDWIPFLHNGAMVSLTDIIGNIILFVPLGFLLYLYLSHRWPGRVRIVPIVVIGAILGTAIETLQLFFRYRVTSTHDVINNTFGTFLGVLAAILYVRYLEKRIERGLRQILQHEPLTLLILLLVAGGLFSSLLPFNLSITISDFKHSLKNTNIEPFGMYTLGQYLGVTGAGEQNSAFQWSALIQNIMFYMMYGYLVLYAYFKYWKGRPRALWKWAVLTVVLVPLLELLQIMIRSRFSDINDLIAGYTGITLGSVLFYLSRRKAWFLKSNDLQIRHFFPILAVYAAFIGIDSFHPFNFSLSPEVIRDDLELRNLVPFYQYYKVTSLWNIYDVLKTFFMTVPLGLIAGYYMRDRYDYPRLLPRLAIVGVVLGSFLESAQLFLETRTADITDVIFIAAGLIAGFIFYRYYHKNYAGNGLERIRKKEAISV